MSKNKEPLHVDDWIEDFTFEEDKFERYAKWVLHHARLPAILSIFFEPIMKRYTLFCTFEDKVYRVTGASSLGDVWLTSNYQQETGYEKRVNVESCSKWSAYSDRQALLPEIAI